MGEQLACQFLERKGFAILHRNWRNGHDELDIVARDGRFLVVVEVKTRSTDRFGHPEEAVGPAKARKLLRAADAFIATTGTDLELRFDVVSVTLGRTEPELLHIPDAFYPTLDEHR
ncbi:MAG: YraN family protein [Flavobacteriales bacterium]|nr:YraN family protein [Flavobacteriales bacterium]